MDTFKRGWRAFVAWYRKRPFIGGVLTVLGGAEMFFSGQLELGNLKVQVGIEGFQATLIPIVLVLVGVLATLMPQHRIFYGVIAMVVAVYSLVGVNLGGFFVGMILAGVGGVMIVSWMPRKAAEPDTVSDTSLEHEAGGSEAGRSSVASSTADLDAFGTVFDTDDDTPTEPRPFPSAPDGADAEPPSARLAAGSTPVLEERPKLPPLEQSTAPGRRRASTRRRATGGALAVALTVLASSGIVALQPQRASAAEATGVCVLGFLGDCSSPSPAPSDPGPSSNPTDSPSPSPSPGPLSGLLPGSSDAPDGGNEGAAAVPAGPTLLAPAADAPEFSGIPALLQGSSLTFNGLRYLGLATVHIAAGKTATVLKLSMDSNELTGFNLDVRDAGGKGVDTVATSMSFTGGVSVYLASLQGVLANGDRVTYDITHPPSSDGSMPVVRIVSLEVFGITGGSSALTGFHEAIS